MRGQPSCQGHGWGAVRVPDEERETRETRETRSVGRAGDCSWPRNPAPGRGRGLRKEGLAGRLAGWLVGGLEGLVRLSVRPSVRPDSVSDSLGRAWGRGDGRAGVQERRPVLQQALVAPQRQHASVYGHTTLNAPDLV